MAPATRCATHLDDVGPRLAEYHKPSPGGVSPGLGRPGAGLVVSVRFKIALTIVATGVITLLAVVACVLYAFMRFEHETTFQRANAFLARVTANYDDLLDLQQRQPAEFRTWLRGLVLYEPDTQL